MKQMIRLVAVALIATTSYAQHTLDMGQDPNSISEDTSLAITSAQKIEETIQGKPGNFLRIRMVDGSYSWGERFSYHRTFVNTQTKEEHVFQLETEVFDIPITLEEVKALSVARGVDCFSIKIDIKENQQHYFKDVGCNRAVQKLIGQVHSAVVSDELQAFIHQLPSGIYNNIMTSMIVNQPIVEEAKKTACYKKIENALREEGISTANALEQPLIDLDGETAFFEDINALEEEELVSCQILTGPMATALYGGRAIHGVVVIETTKGEKQVLYKNNNGPNESI